MKEIIAGYISKSTGLKEEEVLSLLEIPKDSALGDYAFPCFSLARIFKKNPAEIAQDLSEKIKNNFEFERVNAVGPYVNIFLNRSSLAEEVLKKIQKEKGRFGSSGNRKEKIMIEFSEANTHKAFHIGHVRGTSLGESLARIMEFSGKEVLRNNYQGDTGMHVAKWIWCYKKFHKKEKIMDDESWIASVYVDAVKRLAKDETLQEEVDEINRKLESREDKDLNSLWEKTRKLSLDSLEKIYKDLNTGFDKYFFESEMESGGKKIVQELEKKKLAKLSEGAIVMDLKDYNLGVWVLLRKDGTVLYSAKDLALVEEKFSKYKIKKAIYVVGAEQKLHFQQLAKTLELMKSGYLKNCQFVHFELVRLPTGKMSSRTGDNVLYSDFKNELVDYAKEEIRKRHKISEREIERRALAIAIASLKYSMLKQDADKVIVFDKQEALSFEGNTGPYLLYTYARARSILEKAKYSPKKKFSFANLSDIEKNLVFQMDNFRKVVSEAYNNLAPNLIANYAFQIAQTFNEFYHANQVIGSENEQFRLVLVDSFSIVLKKALSLLGIDVVEKM
ncbi:MAG: arginine--tRNA ligase [archaeon]|jgi:arginyl-tRNA synthetase|nr:arginine--tRNA ligase [archaeon]